MKSQPSIPFIETEIVGKRHPKKNKKCCHYWGICLDYFTWIKSKLNEKYVGKGK
jgi:hypothetical protein